MNSVNDKSCHEADECIILKGKQMTGQNKGVTKVDSSCVRPQGGKIWNVNMQLHFGGCMGTGSGRIQVPVSTGWGHSMISPG